MTRHSILSIKRWLDGLAFLYAKSVVQKYICLGRKSAVSYQHPILLLTGRLNTLVLGKLLE